MQLRRAPSSSTLRTKASETILPQQDLKILLIHFSLYFLRNLPIERRYFMVWNSLIKFLAFVDSL